MILLDTNILSELMRPVPEPSVLHWIDGIKEIDTWISAITVSEIKLGIAILPAGRRKTLFFELADEVFIGDFQNRCLPFDCEASQEYVRIVAERKQAGLPITVEDAQIAAIAITAGLTLATRNTKDFSGIEISQAEMELKNTPFSGS